VKYKIFYHFGDELSTKTKVKNGFLLISENNIYLTESDSNTRKLDNIVNVDLTTIPGGGHCIKIYCSDFIIFISVIRFSMFESFVLVNYRKTMEVYKKLKGF
jgi:hypothetical protein